MGVPLLSTWRRALSLVQITDPPLALRVLGTTVRGALVQAMSGNARVPRTPSSHVLGSLAFASVKRRSVDHGEGEGGGEVEAMCYAPSASMLLHNTRGCVGMSGGVRVTMIQQVIKATVKFAVARARTVLASLMVTAGLLRFPKAAARKDRCWLALSCLDCHVGSHVQRILLLFSLVLFPSVLFLLYTPLLFNSAPPLLFSSLLFVSSSLLLFSSYSPLLFSSSLFSSLFCFLIFSSLFSLLSILCSLLGALSYAFSQTAVAVHCLACR